MCRRRGKMAEIAESELIWSALDTAIAETAELEARAAELHDSIKAGRKRIQEIMTRLGLYMRDTSGGHAALLVESKTYEWDLGRLAAVLNPDEIAILCPRRPDAVSLRRLMESDPARGRELRRCARAVTIRRLTLRIAEKAGEGPAGKRAADSDVA